MTWKAPHRHSQSGKAYDKNTIDVRSHQHLQIIVSRQNRRGNYTREAYKDVAGQHKCLDTAVC